VTDKLDKLKQRILNETRCSRVLSVDPRGRIYRVEVRLFLDADPNIYLCSIADAIKHIKSDLRDIERIETECYQVIDYRQDTHVQAIVRLIAGGTAFAIRSRTVDDLIVSIAKHQQKVDWKKEGF
jgi:hypothetical protein